MSVYTLLLQADCAWTRQTNFEAKTKLNNSQTVVKYDKMLNYSCESNEMGRIDERQQHINTWINEIFSMYFKM